MGGTERPLEYIARKTICLSQPTPDVVIHDGHQQFTKELGRLYPKEESNLLEELVQLKATLRQTRTEDFWSLLTERMADVLNAQIAFVSKRILVDEQDAAVEMPPLGEPGSCLMASAFHYTTGKGAPATTVKAFKYNSWGCPCSYMRHDKVFLIPEKLNDFIPTNTVELPFSCDAYIGVPLFADGKSFAHVGVMWSVEGAKTRTLSWATIELFLHSLEDVIRQRLLEGSTFAEVDGGMRERSKIIPHEAITVAQSLKPYARSLSHELRTPMQGVVGMLDVMYATVQEAAEGQTSEEVRRIFETLKDNIETVQDSSRRAVEAADNVVHAYDMDMAVPDVPAALLNEESNALRNIHDRPEILVEGSNLSISRPNKRRREDGLDAHPAKVQETATARASKMEPSEGLKQGVIEAEELPQDLDTPTLRREFPSPPRSDFAIAPGMRHTQVRTVLQYVVNEGLKVGGRPDSAIARETDTGEIIEVQSKSHDGEPRIKTIEWSVEDEVPETMFIDEKDFGKLISCVFLNAVKFTQEGQITVFARMSSTCKFIVIKVTDTGPGIPAAFLPKLFKPFSQENPSLTRQSEGLGLGLLVAKGIARKLGGDLLCVRANTSPTDHGSEFEMRVPVTPGEILTRSSSPASFSSPAAKRTHSRSAEYEERSRHTPTPKRTQAPAAASSSTDSAKAAPVSDTAPKPHTSPAKAQFQLPYLPNMPRPGATNRTHPRDRPSIMARKSSATMLSIDRELATKHPLTFLVAEDNKINRKLLVNMLTKFGYQNIHEAYDGAEAVRQMQLHAGGIDVVLMDLWMPFMDGYEATEKILAMKYDLMDGAGHGRRMGGASAGPTVLAVTADVTDGALKRAAKVGMKGFMTKPFKLLDLQRLILEYCARSTPVGHHGEGGGEE